MRVGLSTLMIQRGRTGVAQYVFSLVQQFKTHAANHQFTLFVLEQDRPFFTSVEDIMSVVPVPEKYRSPVRNILWHQQNLPRLVRAHGLEVLHIPSYRRLLAKKPCALVATIHDLAPFRVPGKYDWKRMFYGRVVVRWLAHRQDRIIAVSQNTADDLMEFFKLPRSRIQVIHNGLDQERFNPQPSASAGAAIAQRFGLREPFFLYVARLEHPGKNHLRLIAAFERFKKSTGSPCQLIFGGSDWHGAEVIHSAIRNSSQRADIKSLGFVEEKDLPHLYRAARAFVYPSLYEGFGLPPLEAMACGCPVISSTRGSLGEVIGDAAIKVNPEDIDDMARAMSQVSHDEVAQSRLRVAGLRQARNFNWRRTADETLKVYEQAIDPSVVCEPLLEPVEHTVGAAN